ncbi:MAG: TlpA family protein disulfide reductase, partial [Myxococcota bacterium]
MKEIAQLLFIVLAAVGVYSFVRAAQADHRLTSCQAWCQFRPHYAGTDRRVPDFELSDGKG